MDSLERWADWITFSLFYVTPANYNLLFFSIFNIKKPQSSLSFWCFATRPLSLCISSKSRGQMDSEGSIDHFFFVLCNPCVNKNPLVYFYFFYKKIPPSATKTISLHLAKATPFHTKIVCDGQYFEVPACAHVLHSREFARTHIKKQLHVSQLSVHRWCVTSVQTWWFERQSFARALQIDWQRD